MGFLFLIFSFKLICIILIVLQLAIFIQHFLEIFLSWDTENSLVPLNCFPGSPGTDGQVACFCVPCHMQCGSGFAGEGARTLKAGHGAVEWLV